MSPWTIYILLKLDDVAKFAWTIAVISLILAGIAMLVGFIIFADYDRQPFPPLAKKMIKWFVPLGLVFALFGTLLPSTKEAAAIYLIPKVVNNESVQNISSNTLHLLEEYTGELLRDMKDEASKKIQSKPEDKPKAE